MSEPEHSKQTPDQAPAPSTGNREIAAALGLLTQLGISMATCVFLGVLLGKYLDQWLGTSPGFLVICSLLGAASSFKVLYDLAIKKWMK